MLRLNSLIYTSVLCLAISACQTVEQTQPKPIQVKPVAAAVEPTVQIETPKSKQKAPPPEPVDLALKPLTTAIKQIKQNDLAAAQLTLSEFLKEHDDARVRLNLALVYLQSDQLDQAKKLLNDLKAQKQQLPIVLEHLAIIARKQGQFTQAQTLYKQAIQLSDKPSIHLNYAILLDLYLNQPKQALLHYELYKNANLAKQDKVKIEQWIAELKTRLKKAQQ